MAKYPNSGIKKRVIDALTTNPYKWMNVEAIATKLGCVNDPAARVSISSACQTLSRNPGLDMEVDKSNSGVFKYRYAPKRAAMPTADLPVAEITPEDKSFLEGLQLELPLAGASAPRSAMEWITLVRECLVEVEQALIACDQRVDEAYERGRQYERDKFNAYLQQHS